MLGDCQWTASGEIECKSPNFGGGGSGNVFGNGIGQVNMGTSFPTELFRGDSSSAGSCASGNCSKMNRDIDTMNRQSGENKKSELKWSTISLAGQYKDKSPAYYFTTAREKLPILAQEFGEPTLINYNSGGSAIWDDTTLRAKGYDAFKEIKLTDEQVLNRFPITHAGNLYTSVKIIIPEDKIANVLSMTGDISYDPTKAILTVRGVSLNYDLSLISLICLYTYGRVSWYDILNKNLVKQSINYSYLKNPLTQQKNIEIINKYLK